MCRCKLSLSGSLFALYWIFLSDIVVVARGAMNSKGRKISEPDRECVRLVFGKYSFAAASVLGYSVFLYRFSSGIDTFNGFLQLEVFP